MSKLHKPSSTLRTPSVVKAGWLVLVAAIVGVAVAVYQLRADALADARRNVVNLALILGELTERSVHAVDLVLQDVQEAVADLGGAEPARFEEVVGGESFGRGLRERLVRVPQADLLAVMDPRGALINASGDISRLGIDLTASEQLRHFAANDDSRISVTVPAADRTDGARMIYFARRIVASDGRSLGLALAGVTLQHFANIYHVVDLSRDEGFRLLRRDGTLLVQHPQRTSGELRRAMPAESPWHQLVAQGGGVYDSPGYFDDVPRLVAVHPLKGYPLVLNVSVAESAVLATWRRQALVRGIGAALILGYAAFLIRLSRRQFAALSRSRASLKQQNESLMRLSGELERSKSKLAATTHDLQAILETMDQGLLMVDRLGEVVHCNERARVLLDIPADLMSRRPKFIELLAYQWEVNRSSQEDGTFEEFVRKRMTADRAHIQELRRPDGRVLEVRGVPMAGGGFVRTYTDITARKIAEDQVRYLAHHDDLTRLTNRVAFRERLEEAIDVARGARRGAAVLYLDLDRFKEINDTRGHDAGDRVLSEAAQRLRVCVRAIDTVARLGGDEFAIVLPFLDDEGAAEELARHLIATVGQPYIIGYEPCVIGLSIGIALFPQDALAVEELLIRADAALYAAKRAGRNTFRMASQARGAAYVPAAE